MKRESDYADDNKDDANDNSHKKQEEEEKIWKTEIPKRKERNLR